MASHVAVSRLTVKHQATIPAAVRKKLGLYGLAAEGQAEDTDETD